ncbi:MAG: apolipoprotein N-acyltransferase [Actinobacteria bacterium]|nr:apolipoprotein N-acyltransferase [Actinomycetota bacterium]
MKKQSLVALIAGSLVALSLPPWGWWPLAYLGVALFTTIKPTSNRARFMFGTLFALAWLAPGMAWMWFLTAPGYVIAALLFSALHGIAAMITGAVNDQHKHRAVVGPLAHTLAEALRFSFPFGGVPLATLAISQAASPLAPIVRVGGPLLLTYIVLQIGFLLADLRETKTPKRAVHAALIAVVVVAILPIAGLIAPHGHDIGRSLTIAAVQGGGPQGTLAINTNSRDVVVRHLDATRTIAGGSVTTDNNLDLVVWPENVIDVSSFSSSIERTEVAAEAARLDAPFLVGITEDFDNRFFTNAQAVVNTDGSIGNRYDKVRRVPFGEFVPMRGLLEAVGAPVDRIPRDAQAGKDTAILRAADTTIAVVISWEVFFAGRANEGVERGATLLVNPTNGSSYTGTILQTQQIASSRLRALETGRWLVQVSPTGFSAFISPSGQVFDRTGVSEQRVITREVQLRSGRTIYSYLGDMPFILIMIASLLALLIAGRRTTRA